MLEVSRLLCGAGDHPPQRGQGVRHLRFGRAEAPVVIWNVTRRCNLRCLHCYLDSADRPYPGELSRDEGLALIGDLASYGVPVIIFSGGEPLLRPDLFDLAAYARSRGIHCALSSNGTLITDEVAGRIRAAGFAYVGVSLDGIGEVHDAFRGLPGAYARALEGLRRCRDRGLKVGVRFTLSRQTLDHLPAVMDLVEREGFPRAYVSHLVYSGRGTRLAHEALEHAATRQAVEYLFDRAEDFYRRGLQREIVTGNNDADGVALYLWVRRRHPERAEAVWRLLKARGGNSSGTALGSIDSLGEVHADPFWADRTFGNVRRRPFGEIWSDTSDLLMAGLKRKAAMVRGRCAWCQYLDICGGNSRVRAEAVTGDVWAPDPACYLTDEEIGAADVATPAP